MAKVVVFCCFTAVGMTSGQGNIRVVVVVVDDDDDIFITFSCLRILLNR